MSIVIKQQPIIRRYQLQVNEDASAHTCPMRSEGYYSNATVCVCALCVCSRFNSLYDDLFGPQKYQGNENQFKRRFFSEKALLQRYSIYRFYTAYYSWPFCVRKNNAHELTRYVPRIISTGNCYVVKIQSLSLEDNTKNQPFLHTDMS